MTSRLEYETTKWRSLKQKTNYRLKNIYYRWNVQMVNTWAA